MSTLQENISRAIVGSALQFRDLKGFGLNALLFLFGFHHRSKAKTGRA